MPVVRTVFSDTVLVLCLSVAIALPARAANVFSYSEDFNSTPDYTVPAGWMTQDSEVPLLNPVVAPADPVFWGALVAPGGGTVNYGVAWSGGKRFTMIHPGEHNPGDIRAGTAWYEGQGEANYPLDLQSASMMAQFDLVLRTGTGCLSGNPVVLTPGDGATFAVQPVTSLASDVTRVGEPLGGLAWGGIDGFAIEFDLFQDADVDSTGADGGNHIALDVRLNWNGGPLPSVVSHLDAPTSVPEGDLPRFLEIGDNNQPIEVTVFYNDPDEGGAGVVRVYIKVDPATKDASESGTPIAFGMDVSDGPFGRLVLEACVGDFPASQAIFGFTAAAGGCDAIIQFDNVSVTADDEGGSFGTTCTPPNITSPSGALAVLDSDLRVTDCGDLGLSSPGWDVKTYTNGAFGVRQTKTAIALQEANASGPAGSATGVSALNYDDGGCAGEFAGSSAFPGIAPGSDDFNLLAKGWMCFPQAGNYTFEINSDDGFEFVIGNGINEQVIGSFDGGRACGFPSRVTIEVAQAGVYPVRMLHFEGGGGAGLEFYQVSDPSSFLLTSVFDLVGAADGSPTVEPIVYGLLNGQQASDGEIGAPAVDLLPGQAVAGTGTGTNGFAIKTVTAPLDISILHNRDDDGNYTGRRFLDLLDDQAGGATVASLNFRDFNGDSTPQPDGTIPGGVAFPGVSGDQFGCRATTFATFPAAATYLLWLDWDDHVHLQIGEQTIFSATAGGQALIPVVVSQPGTYPLRVQHLEFSGDARIELGEFVSGTGIVALGDTGSGSTITVHTQATSGPYVWPSYGIKIETSRKVADIGDGAIAGWNALLGKGVDVGAGSPPVIDKRAYATMLVENNHVDLTPGVFPTGTDAPNTVDYIDVGEAGLGGRFGFDRTIDNFGSVVNAAGSNDALGITVDGYIEFPAPGLYAFALRADDGGAMWIGGVAVAAYPFSSTPEDTTPALLEIEEAGLYDIRADFFEDSGDISFELLQYLPDGNVAALNSPQATVTVYRDLSVAPASTKYANPLFVPGSAKSAAFGDGGTPGMRVQVVNRAFVGGDGNEAVGGDTFRNLAQASELLDAALDGVSTIDQPGTLAGEAIVDEIAFFYSGDYPGPPNPDAFAARITGYLELEAGGYLFEVDSDNGFNFWIGGENPKMDGWHVGLSGSLKGPIAVPFYFTVEEGGLYPFVVEQMELDGAEGCFFGQLQFISSFLNASSVNGPNSSVRAYATLAGDCGVPQADTDADGDVDLADAIVLQQYYSGDGGTIPTEPAVCGCLDYDQDDDIDGADWASFVDCLDSSGPGVAPPADCGQLP